MELRHLEYFVAVAEELSFTRAAERLTIAQSPVSQQIRNLNENSGRPCSTGPPGSVELTEAGRILYAEAIALLAASRRAADNARLAGQGHLGRLALAFTGSATYELMPLLVGLRPALPQRDIGGPQRNAHPSAGRRTARGQHHGRPAQAAGGRRRPRRRGSPARAARRAAPGPTRWPRRSTSS